MRTNKSDSRSMILREPIIVNVTVKSVRFDEDSEGLLTLRIPASDALAAARFAIMRQIVFRAEFKPIDVAETEGV